MRTASTWAWSMKKRCTYRGTGRWRSSSRPGSSGTLRAKRVVRDIRTQSNECVSVGTKTRAGLGSWRGAYIGKTRSRMWRTYSRSTWCTHWGRARSAHTGSPRTLHKTREREPVVSPSSRGIDKAQEASTHARSWSRFRSWSSCWTGQTGRPGRASNPHSFRPLCARNARRQRQLIRRRDRGTQGGRQRDAPLDGTRARRIAMSKAATGSTVRDARAIFSTALLRVARARVQPQRRKGEMPGRQRDARQLRNGTHTRRQHN